MLMTIWIARGGQQHNPSTTGGGEVLTLPITGARLRGQRSRGVSSGLPAPGSVWQNPSTASTPVRFGYQAWTAISIAFIAVYVVMWSVVHVRVDMRPCAFHLPDPLFFVIPKDGRWYVVSHELYTVLTISCVAAFAFQALSGNHAPLLRLGAALTVQGVLRSTTILLIPACRANLPVGTVPLNAVPYLDLGLIRVPWRMWATNDLVFSGHVGEFLLIYWAARSWPPLARTLLVIFQVLQAYALIATRGHYTLDIVLAVPSALLADAAARRLLSRFVAKQGSTASVEPA
jgi:hypothetical protein